MSLEYGTGHLRREKEQQDKASDIALVGVIGPCQDSDWPEPLVQEIAPPTLREALRRDLDGIRVVTDALCHGLIAAGMPAGEIALRRRSYASRIGAKPP
jgi:hypothetical protein